jgi:hypothetical protein
MIMNYLRFALLVMLSAVFVSCPAERDGAEIVYDNRSDSVVKPLEDNAVDLNPGEKKSYSYGILHWYDSTVFEFGYIQDGKEVQYPGDIEGPYTRIQHGETKTVVIYNDHYEIR